MGPLDRAGTLVPRLYVALGCFLAVDVILRNFASELPRPAVFALWALAFGAPLLLPRRPPGGGRLHGRHERPTKHC